MKQRIRAIHKLRLSQAFNKMKGKKDEIVHADMVFECENIMNDNQNLTNELQSKKAVREKQKVQHGRQRVNKLERVRNMWNRKSLREFYDRWVR
jgi:selenocysteine-specific translation elongation factor